jgi:hypothetical protein
MPGTNLEIPGLEAILEYGDASKVVRDHIPGAMLINDHSRLDRVRITQMDGLHDDPEGSETRQPNPDRHGESAGAMLYRGRTIGFTGRVEAGNIGAMRNNWRRFRGQFGTFERDLLVHHPFEVRALANEVPNPVFAVDTQTWSDPFTTSGSATLDPATLFGGTTTMGALAVTGTTGAGSVRTTTNLLDDAFFLPQVQPWTGQDVWITALVRVASTTLAVGAVSLGLTEWFHAVPGVGASSTVPVAATKVVQNSPVTGTWYLLSLRVPANAFKPSTTYVTPTVQLDYSSGGNATLNVTAVAVVFVDADEPSPASYFDGDVAGYDWEGVPNLSRSIGPTHAENMVVDPRFEDFNASTSVLTNWTYEAASITVNTVPSRSFGWTDDDFDAAGYFRATKDSSTAARSYGVVATGNVLTKFRVVAGRRYRWSIKANLVQKPTGTVVAAIQWYDLAGALVSTSSSDPLVLGVNDATVDSRRAGAGDVGAVLPVDAEHVNRQRPAGDVLHAAMLHRRHRLGSRQLRRRRRCRRGSRPPPRRIPRPFLHPGSVRKTSDMKAPEQQSRSRAWRDFTMSLRASDPRVYCLDPRRRSYEHAAEEPAAEHDAAHERLHHVHASGAGADRIVVRGPEHSRHGAESRRVDELLDRAGAYRAPPDALRRHQPGPVDRQRRGADRAANEPGSGAVLSLLRGLPVQRAARDRRVLSRCADGGGDRRAATVPREQQQRLRILAHHRVARHHPRGGLREHGQHPDQARELDHMA